MQIYKHTSPSGKCYIGKTTRTMECRLKEHVLAAEKGISSAFYRAIRKYGIETFSSEILEDCISENSLNTREIYWISHYNSHTNGYNMTIGGDGGNTWLDSPSYAVRAKHLSNIFTGEGNPFFGKNHTQEVCDAIGKRTIGNTWRKGTTHSQATKDIISNKGVVRFKDQTERDKVSNGMRNYNLSHPEAITNRIQKMKENDTSANNTQTYKITLESGVEILLHGKKGVKTYATANGLSYRKLARSIGSGKIAINMADKRTTKGAIACHNLTIVKQPK